MDALPIPDDLVELQRAVYAARALSEAFSNTIDRELQAVFPGKDQWRQRQWPEDSDERAELARLRQAVNDAVDAVRQHPVIVQAYAQKAMPATEWALKRAAKI